MPCVLPCNTALASAAEAIPCAPSLVASAITWPPCPWPIMLSIVSGMVMSAKAPKRDSMRGNSIRRSDRLGFRYIVMFAVEALNCSIFEKAEVVTSGPSPTVLLVQSISVD